MPTLCYDPNICHVKTHRNTICKARLRANEDTLIADDTGLIEGRTPQQLTERTLGEHDNGIVNAGIDEDIVYVDDPSEVTSDSYDKPYELIDDVKIKVKDTYLLASGFLHNGYGHDRGIKDNYSLSKILERNGLHAGMDEYGVFTYDIINDYYQQSVTNIRINKNTKVGKKIYDSVEKFFTLSSNDRIRYALTTEYGYVLPQLEEATFTVEKLFPQDVTLPDADFHIGERFTNLMTEEYNPRTGRQYSQAVVKGIVIPLGNGKYKLVDGRHRQVHASRDERGTYIVAHTSY